jgi:hypothetical protein
MADKRNISSTAVTDYLKSIGGTQAAYKPITGFGEGDRAYSAMKDQDSSDQDFLSWIIDIASRPLFAGSETVSSIIDAADPQSGMDLGQRVGHVASAPFRGFFSNNPEDKIYYADLIEKGTDVVGKNTDPSYVDKQNNVDPLLKGTLGFVGDVAADPLSYIGLGALKTAGKAVKAGVGAVAPKATEAVARAVTKATGKVRKADDVADIDPMAKTIADAETEVLVDDVIQSSVDDSIPTAAVPEPTPVPVKPLTKAQQKVADAKAAADLKLKKFSEKFGDAPLRTVITATKTPGGKKALTEQIRDLQEPTSYADEVGNLVDETPRKFEDFQQQLQKITRESDSPVEVTIRREVDKIDGSGTTFIDDKINVSELVAKADRLIKRKPSKSVNDANKALNAMQGQRDEIMRQMADIEGQKATPELSRKFEALQKALDRAEDAIADKADDIKALEGTNSVEYQDILEELGLIYDKYLNAFNVKAYDKSGGKVVSLLGDVISVDSVAKVTTALGNYQLMYVAAKDLAQSIFGPDLANQLRLLGPDNFEKSLNDFIGILDKDGMIDEVVASGGTTLGDRTKRLAKFIERVGVDYESFRKLQDAAMTRAQLSVNTANTPIEKVLEDFIPENQKLLDDYGLDRLSSNEVISIVKQAIIEVFGKDLDMKTLGERLKYRSDSGVLQSSDDFGIGVSRDLTRTNTFFQYDLYKAIGERVFELGKSQKLSGLKLIEFRYNNAKGALELAEDFFRQNGFNLHLDNPLGNERFMLSVTDVLETLYGDVGSKNYYALGAAFFNNSKAGKEVIGTGSAITKFLDATAVALAGGNKAAVRKMLTGTTQRNKAKITAAEARAKRAKLNAEEPGLGGIEKIPNFLSLKEKTGVAGFVPKPRNGKLEDIKTKVEGATLVTNSEKTGKYIAYKADDLADILTDAIMDNLDALKLLEETNLKATGVKLNVDAFTVAKKTINDLLKNFSDDKQVADGILAVAKLKNTTVDNAVKVGASPTAHAAAEVIVDNAVGPTAQKVAKNQLKRSDVAKATTKAGTEKPAEKVASQKARNKVNQETAQNGQDIADDNLEEMLQAARSGELPPEAADEVIAEATEEVYKKASSDTFAGINATVASLMAPLHKLFVANHGQVNEMIDLHELTRSFGNRARILLSKRTKAYSQLGRKYGAPIDAKGTTALEQAFRLIQQPEAGPGANPEIAGAYDELSRIVNTLFDTTNKTESAVLNTAFMRNDPGGLEYLNKVMKEFRILSPNNGYKTKEAEKFVGEGNDFFDLSKAIDMKRRMAKQGKNVDLLTAAMQQWREWPVDDVLDFLSKADAVMLRASTDLGVVGSLQRTGLKAGFISETAQDGFVKLDFGGKSRFGMLLQDGYYYDKEVADMIYRMDEAGMFSTKLGGDLGKWINGIYDPLLSSWQYGITQLRPGHHVRNFVGNGSIQYLSEGTKFMPRSINDAIKAMHLFGNYTDADLMRILNAQGDVITPRPGEVFSRGNYGEMTRETVAEAYQELGMRRTANIVDDIWESEGIVGKFGKILDKVTLRNTKVGEMAGGLSELNDNFGRMSHFMQIIHKEQAATVKRFKTTEELYKYAAKRVQKFHPDSTTLSDFEKKYMRRIFPFYSWTRGAIPALLETMMYNPGRVMNINKASYNLAISMGTNPDSLSDPFPEDQMFPSFLTEKVQGPQFKIGGKYYSVSPGFISWDLPNTFGADPFRGTLGMTSPILRVPLELITGSSVGTGSKIRDFSDYVDSNIPGINYVANVSGYSPTGSVASMLQGMGMDPMAQVDAGNRTGTSAGLSAINWLTGLGISEYSKPNYINYAEIEKRNREAPKDRSGY